MKVDPKEWDPPEYLPISSRNFLIDRAQTMHHVQQAAYLTMGQILLQVREKFKNDPKLDGWWTRWVEEATPLSRDSAGHLMAVASAAKEDPTFLDLSKEYTATCLSIVARLPHKLRSGVAKAIVEVDTHLTQDQLSAISSSPEAELCKAEELVQQLQTTIVSAQLRQQTTADSRERGNAKALVSKTTDRLDIALQRLSEARQKVNSLEKERSTQELVMDQLQAQLRQQQLKVEEMSLDPKAKRKRAVARTIVDATNGLDLLLSSIDKYQVDKDDIGAEAVKTIERKMAQVKAKLLELHYQDEWVESANTP